MAADWHELVVPQLIMWPSIASANGHSINQTRGSASRHDCVTFHVPLIIVFIATVDDTLTRGGVERSSAIVKRKLGLTVTAS